MGCDLPGFLFPPQKFQAAPRRGLPDKDCSTNSFVDWNLSREETKQVVKLQFP
jgi:hypothetical protein